MFVYTEYNDELPYGEEIIELFDERKDAEAHLREQVESFFGIPFEQIVEMESEQDEFSADYCRHSTSDGDLYWVVHEKHIQKGNRSSYYWPSCLVISGTSFSVIPVSCPYTSLEEAKAVIDGWKRQSLNVVSAWIDKQDGSQPSEVVYHEVVRRC